MFERRLKTFLAILLVFSSVLLVRAFHLQVFTHASWVKDAEELKEKSQPIETTRGRILDFKGHTIAVDEPCLDACVDYRAITKDEKWIRDLARDRAFRAAGEEAWKHLDAKTRGDLIEQAGVGVKLDLDRIVQVLSEETGHTPEEIDETYHQIALRVAISSRLRQYKRWWEANQDHQNEVQASWYRKWVIDGGQDGPQLDSYEETGGDELGVHPIVRNISRDVYLRLARELPNCPGLVIMPGTHRTYPYGRAGAHLIGALAPVTREDVGADHDPDFDDSTRRLRVADLIGRGGLESLLEPALRGTRGILAKNPGKDDRVLTAPVPGANVLTTIDIELEGQIRTFFEQMEVPSNLMDDQTIFKVAMHGAAVVLDIKTGEVRAMVSYPDFDPNTLSDDYEKLTSGDQLYEAPLLNRATQSQLEPGSTIKPVVGLSAITAGLNVPDVGVMTTRTGIECTGYLVINKHKMPNGRCWVASKFEKRIPSVAHHPVPTEAPHRGVYGNPDGFLCFADALERSCNVYFETCANAFGSQALSEWYDRFGLGHETGVGIAESCGLLPRQMQLQEPSIVWFSGIGQTGLLATPIQMANVAATIARHGIWVRPRLVDDPNVPTNPVKLRDGRTLPDRIDLHLSPEALAAAKEGMIRVVNNPPAGTGTVGHMDELLVAGKTGTAQATRIMKRKKDADGNDVPNSKGKLELEPWTPTSATVNGDAPWYRGWGEEGKQINHAWFVGFAPANDPQVAFAVMVQYGGSGGLTAANTARKILKACIQHGYITPGRPR